MPWDDVLLLVTDLDEAGLPVGEPRWRRLTINIPLSAILPVCMSSLRRLWVLMHKAMPCHAMRLRVLYFTRHFN
jgi:hypothetical protein